MINLHSKSNRDLAKASYPIYPLLLLISSNGLLISFILILINVHDFLNKKSIIINGCYSLFPIYENKYKITF